MAEIQRGQLEELLKLNGVDTSAGTDEIRSVLISAHWNNNDIETAILVLKEDSTSKKSHVDTFHHVFHTDDKLTPEMVTNLLNIDMEVAPEALKHKSQVASLLTPGQIFRLIGMSITLSALCILFAMWHFKIGVFYIP